MSTDDPRPGAAASPGPGGDASPHLLTGAYAVDALDDRERPAFEAHLLGCPDCRAEVAAMRAAVARLATADATAPPPALRAAVLAEVARTSQEAGAADVVRIPRRSRAVVVLAVAATLLGLLAVALGVLLAQARTERDQLSAQAQQVAAVVTAPDARAATAAVKGGGRGTVVVSDGLQSAAFVGDDLAAPPAGHVYQLWFIDAAGRAASAGTFSPGPHGSAAVPLTGQPGTATTVGLTVEPDGGSPQPTTQPVLAVPLPT